MTQAVILLGLIAATVAWRWASAWERVNLARTREPWTEDTE